MNFCTIDKEALGLQLEDRRAQGLQTYSRPGGNSAPMAFSEAGLTRVYQFAANY